MAHEVHEFLPQEEEWFAAILACTGREADQSLIGSQFQGHRHCCNLPWVGAICHGQSYT